MATIGIYISYMCATTFQSLKCFIHENYKFNEVCYNTKTLQLSEIFKRDRKDPYRESQPEQKNTSTNTISTSKKKHRSNCMIIIDNQKSIITVHTLVVQKWYPKSSVQLSFPLVLFPTNFIQFPRLL